MTTEEIYADLFDAQAKAQIVRESPLYQALRRETETRWCCEYLRKKDRPCLTFKDGTKLRIHFCPRCGREL
jgi:hypothetical protein